MTDEEYHKRVRETMREDMVRTARLKHGLKTGNWDARFRIVEDGLRGIVSTWGMSEQLLSG